jgi:hypothetical protein
MITTPTAAWNASCLVHGFVVIRTFPAGKHLGGRTRLGNAREQENRSEQRDHNNVLKTLDHFSTPYFSGFSLLPIRNESRLTCFSPQNRKPYA